MALRGRYHDMKTLRPGLEELLDRGALVRGHRGTSVGRKRESYLVNPAIHLTQEDLDDL